MVFVTAHDQDDQVKEILPHYQRVPLPQRTFFFGLKQPQKFPSELVHLHNSNQLEKLQASAASCLLTRFYVANKSKFEEVKLEVNHTATDKVNCKHNDWAFIEASWNPPNRDDLECQARYYGVEETLQEL